LLYETGSKFAELIYKEPNAFCLMRKKEKWLKVIENRKTWAPEYKN